MQRACLLVLWLAVSWAVQAQTPPVQPTIQDPPTFMSEQVSGQIQKWEPETGALVLNADDDQLVLEISEGSTVFIDGRLGQSTELAPGQSVRAAYKKKDGVFAVRWIEVLKPAAPKRPSKTDASAPLAPAFGSYEGRIASVDTQAQTFVLASLEGFWKLDLRDVVVIVEGQRVEINTLAEGAQVRATWEANATPRTLRVESLEPSSPPQPPSEPVEGDNKTAT